MSKAVRKQLFSILDTLSEATNLLNRLLQNGKVEEAASLLIECQECAIAIGTKVDSVYGEGTDSVHALEEYCEYAYRLSETLGSYAERDELRRQLSGQIAVIREAMEREIPDKLEMVFLPYKASMWDSLESVYLAAKADESCDAYCVAIPYFDKNKDGSLGEMHYEGGDYPAEIEITDWRAYDFSVRRPDVVFIHNPYDEYNFVTSVHPFFYSKNLKQYTDTLVYIPYYSTAGGMGDAQRLCSAYLYADYIVIQAEKYTEFFDAMIPREKFLPFGSPKFDKVLKKCMNPTVPPSEWTEKMRGRKVYFYNTSPSGMLENTKAFLEKMEYVFRSFAGREDACLLWRPHPLLESTFASLREEYRSAYASLKKFFLEQNIGIYDDTSDITDTIALCDAYIGDAGTSVTSLFGIAGKPLFILNNAISTAPNENDWQGEIIKGLRYYGDNQFMVTQGNKLYYSPQNDYHYEYYCDLSEYAYGWYYSHVISVGGKHYVCPVNAQDILQVEEGKIKRRITIESYQHQKWSFVNAISAGKYILLIPSRWPAVIKYDTETEQISYYTEYADKVQKKGLAWETGGFCVHDGRLFVASLKENCVWELDIESGLNGMRIVGEPGQKGYCAMYSDGEEIWTFPCEGAAITRWNPERGEVQKYENYPKELRCKHPQQGYSCMEKPFGAVAFTSDYVYLPPGWGNLFLRMNKKSGEITEWAPDVKLPEEPLNGYYVSGGKAYFLYTEKRDDAERLLFSVFDRKLYNVNLETGESRELAITFDKADVEECEPGFARSSERLQYACYENAFNTLQDFLDGTIKGKAFCREKQIEAFETIIANSSGTCGETIYRYMKEHAEKR